jgi:hypothetical protein
MVRVIGLEASEGPAREAVEDLFGDDTTRPGQLNAGRGVGWFRDRTVATRGEHHGHEDENEEQAGKTHHGRR